jgi:hypothetical protein
MLVGEEEYRGVQGSYCWGEICVDYAMPSMRKDINEKLSIPEGATISFEVLDNISYENFHVTIFSKEKIVQDGAVKKEMKIQVPAGTYFFNVKATWEGKGDTSNVFQVDVM